MDKKTYISLALLVFGLLFGFYVGLNIVEKKNETQLNTSSQEEITSKNCLSDQCLAPDVDYPASELSDTIKQTLLDGLDDEYKAYATYRAVTDNFGNVRPFIMISRAELQHITALQGLFEKYNIEIPENPYLGKVSSPVSLSEACSIGVEAEIANIKLYEEKLLPIVLEYPDITQVYTNLMNASEQKHLPAFERCK